MVQRVLVAWPPNFPGKLFVMFRREPVMLTVLWSVKGGVGVSVTSAMLAISAAHTLSLIHI